MSGDQAEIYVSDMPAPADTSAEAFDRIAAKVRERSWGAESVREPTPAEREARVAQARRMFVRDVERVALAVLPSMVVIKEDPPLGVELVDAFNVSEWFVKEALRRRGIKPEIIEEVTR